LWTKSGYEAKMLKKRKRVEQRRAEVSPLRTTTAVHEEIRVPITSRLGLPSSTKRTWGDVTEEPEGAEDFLSDDTGRGPLAVEPPAKMARHVTLVTQAFEGKMVADLEEATTSNRHNRRQGRHAHGNHWPAHRRGGGSIQDRLGW